ncbi:hypothetical protein VUR80DRAFT_4139 [Thermomyces stellatus]
MVSKTCSLGFLVQLGQRRRTREDTGTKNTTRCRRSHREEDRDPAQTTKTSGSRGDLVYTRLWTVPSSLRVVGGWMGAAVHWRYRDTSVTLGATLDHAGLFGSGAATKPLSKSCSDGSRRRVRCSASILPLESPSQEFAKSGLAEAENLDSWLPHLLR